MKQKGMSLVGVLAASAIGLIVVVGMMSLITDSYKAQRGVQTKDGQREVMSSIRQLLSDPVICNASFAGVGPFVSSVASIAATSIKASPTDIKYQLGTDYIGNLVTLRGMTLKGYQPDTATFPNVGKLELVITLDKIGNAAGPPTISQTMLLQVTLDASKNIVQCTSLGTSDSLWKISNTNAADIYYPNGNVGIGTATPKTKLEVNGAVKFGTMTNCNADEEGSQRYNSTLKIMEFCDAVSWQALGGSGSLPAGAVMAFDLASCPAGWSEYLAARGRFLRGIDGGAGNDPSGLRAPGNTQADALGNHTHNYTAMINYYGGWSAMVVDNYTLSWYTGWNPIATTATGAVETRSKNVAVLFCRKN